MVNNFETSSNDSEDSAINAWDMSDVSNPLFNESSDTFQIPERNDGKSEEERRYESKERALRDELFAISDNRARYISNTGEEFISLMKQANHPFARRLEENVDNIVSGKKNTGRATLETFFSYIDSMYPSPYSNNTRDPKKADDAADEYRRTSMREGEYTGDTTDELAKTFSIDGSDKDLYIANSLKLIGQDSVDYHTSLARAIIAYAEEPNKNNRSRITNAQYDHEHAMSNSLYNIAEIFDGSRTVIGKKMFEPTIELMQKMTINTEDYFDGIMNYLKFKIDNSPNAPNMEDDDDSSYNQPDVVLY